MKSVEEDKTSADQLMVSFAALAFDKDFITEKDMFVGGLSQQVVEYFKQVMQPKNDGYDYKPYLQNAFGKN